VDRDLHLQRLRHVLMLPRLGGRLPNSLIGGSRIMGYIRDWLRLSEALELVVAAGQSNSEAQSDICNAIANGKIRIQLSADEAELYGKVIPNPLPGVVGIPRDISPNEMDWQNSRPKGSWPDARVPPYRFRVALILLSSADVIEVLCGGKNPSEQSSHPKGIRYDSPAISGIEKAATRALAAFLKGNPDVTRTKAADWCRAQGFSLTKRGFQFRVWPEARKQAGLSATALPGRKPKSSR
jgi:hypothetical protein